MGWAVKHGAMSGVLLGFLVGSVALRQCSALWRAVAPFDWTLLAQVGVPLRFRRVQLLFTADVFARLVSRPTRRTPISPRHFVPPMWLVGPLAADVSPIVHSAAKAETGSDARGVARAWSCRGRGQGLWTIGLFVVKLIYPARYGPDDCAPAVVCVGHATPRPANVVNDGWRADVPVKHR
jgi:hypothetical protein